MTVSSVVLPSPSLTLRLSRGVSSNITTTTTTTSTRRSSSSSGSSLSPLHSLHSSPPVPGLGRQLLHEPGQRGVSAPDVTRRRLQPGHQLLHLGALAEDLVVQEGVLRLRRLQARVELRPVR